MIYEYIVPWELNIFIMYILFKTHYIVPWEPNILCTSYFKHTTMHNLQVNKDPS